MGGSRSKQKGNSFEREVAKFLSDLYNESFVRAAHSGAYVGGNNSHRKSVLSENQIKSFKGDIIPPDNWNYFNAEAKSYADFPFHLTLAGNCKILDGWIDQMMDVAEKNDLNILFMKFNRKGRFVAVQTHLTWVTDIFLYYSSAKHKDWLIVDFEHFFKHNTDLLRLYSQKHTSHDSSTLNSHDSSDTISPSINSHSNSILTISSRSII